MYRRNFSLLNKLNHIINTHIRSYSDQLLPKSIPKSNSVLRIQKKPCRPPFMKNMFLGIFDMEMLVYPELDKISLQALKDNVKPFKDYFEGHVDPKSISSHKMIPQDISGNLQTLGLFGQVVPQIYGGMGLTATEAAFLNEVIAKDLDIALTLYSHNFLCTQAIALYGSENQKSKYLPLLSSGQCISGFCMAEVGTGSDLLSLTTSLTNSGNEQNTYLLNGKKHWVINGKNANIFIVIAKSEVKNSIGKSLPSVRVVIVEKDSPGVVVSEPKEHMGLNGSNICEVHFENTPVHEESFVGSETRGFEMCTSLLNNGRCNIGAITVSILKESLKKAVDFIVTRVQSIKPLVECENIQDKFSYIATRIFALESMTYHTAGILDNYENPDCLLELSIIKVFSFTEGRRCLDLIMEILGGRALLNSELTQKYFRDFRSMEVFDGTIDFTNLFISLTGLQHAGYYMNEHITKLRFPFEYPSFVLSRMFKNRKQIKDDPKLTLNLYEQLHPSLIESANQLEYCVLRLDYAVGVFFQRYGSDVVDQQIELMRLADAAVKIYAMTSVLARSSRSYCIGLPDAESEIKCAVRICQDYKKIVQDELNDLINGLVISGDVYSLQLGPSIFRHKGYFFKHPTERSF